MNYRLISSAAQTDKCQFYFSQFSMTWKALTVDFLMAIHFPHGVEWIGAISDVGHSHSAAPGAASQLISTDHN